MARTLLALTLGFSLLAALGCETTSEEHIEYAAQSELESKEDDRLVRLEEKAREYPKSSKYHYEIAGVHFQRGDYMDAERYLVKAIDLEPTQPRYHYHLGRNFMQQNELAKAEASFRKTLELSKTDRYSGLHTSLGYSLALQGKYREAKEQFLLAVRIEPEKPETYYLLGSIHDIEDNKDRTIYYMREYLQRGGSKYRKKAIQILGQLGISVRPRKPNVDSDDRGGGKFRE